MRCTHSLTDVSATHKALRVAIPYSDQCPEADKKLSVLRVLRGLRVFVMNVLAAGV